MYSIFVIVIIREILKTLIKKLMQQNHCTFKEVVAIIFTEWRNYVSTR